MEEEHSEERVEEFEVPVKELHDMFIEEQDDDSVDEHDDHFREEPELLSAATSTTPPRRPHDTSARHKCTLVDPNTGEPCNADFSRAG